MNKSDKSTKNNIPNFPRKLIYFEKQSNDRLCGVHCLNSLLQGPYFDAVILSEIGLGLDQMENALYSGNYSQHENVSEDGNYNVQVLSEALKSLGAEIQPLKKSEAISLVEKELNKVEAIIFNSSTHWFAIRKIDNIWFNLNSTNSFPGPEIISDFYLSAFIQGTQDIGYTNFLINNVPNLSDVKSDFYSNLQPFQRLISINDVIKAKEAKKIKDVKKDEGSDEKTEEENKFKAFTGKGYALNDDKKQSTYNSLKDCEDDEMKQAYELSLMEYVKDLQFQIPPEPNTNDHTAYNIKFVCNEKSFTRRFREENRIHDLINFAKCELKTFSDLEIFENFPRKIYSDESLNLKDARLSKNQCLMIKLLN